MFHLCQSDSIIQLSKSSWIEAPTLLERQRIARACSAFDDTHLHLPLRVSLVSLVHFRFTHTQIPQYIETQGRRNEGSVHSAPDTRPHRKMRKTGAISTRSRNQSHVHIARLAGPSGFFSALYYLKQVHHRAECALYTHHLLYYGHHAKAAVHRRLGELLVRLGAWMSSEKVTLGRFHGMIYVLKFPLV